jgi:hypothetical protein
MGIEMPHAGESLLPPVPDKLRNSDPELYRFLQIMKSHLDRQGSGLFRNDVAIANVINSGTSGTFTISSGGSLIVTSGIVLTVTS